MDSLQRYLSEQREDSEAGKLLPSPPADLKAVVVVPAFAEREQIPGFLESFQSAIEYCQYPVELIFVINNGDDADSRIIEDNRESIEYLESLAGPYPIYVIDRATGDRAFPVERAGVGLARRVGLDVAAQRCADSGCDRTYLICLDADCRVNAQYLEGIIEEMDADPSARAGVCRYEHELPEEGYRARAVAKYELWLRYISIGLGITGSPYAYHDIGSTLVFTAEGYALADGYSRREALADFETIQKIVKIDGLPRVKHLKIPKVYTSARPSDRVPRGTGAAMREVEESDEIAFDLQPASAFEALREFGETLDVAYGKGIGAWRAKLARRLVEFIESYDGFGAIGKICQNSANFSNFKAGVFTYFDRLKQMRFLNKMQRQNGSTTFSEGFGAFSEYLPTELSRLDLSANEVHVLEQIRERNPFFIKWLEDRRRKELVD